MDNLLSFDGILKFNTDTNDTNTIHNLTFLNRNL